MVVPPMLEPGQNLDQKYRIVRLMGSGGMGSVYEGENARIHRRVAIKVLHAHVAAKADVVARFEREAQAAGRIGSEHIVEVLDLGALPTGERYMVMELLDGEDLGSRIKRKGRLDPREAGPIVRDLLEGLAAAHHAGIIHRDLKPDNVFLAHSKRPGRELVKILDFGVSKFSALDRESMSMTSTGAVMGTPYYMSPEQARGAKIDPRSDLYSVGVLLYQAVTGRVPFDAETFNELVFKIALEAPPPVETLVPGIEPAFAAILGRAMAREAEQRFQSAEEMQRALDAWLGAPGAATAPPATWTGGFQASAPGPAAGNLGTSAATRPSVPPAPFAATPTGNPTAAPPYFGNTPVPSPAYGGTPSGPYAAGPAAPFAHGSPGFGASQVGLSISGAQPSGSSRAIAVAIVAAALVMGAGLGAYVFLSRAAPAPAEPVAATSAPDAAPPPAAPSANTPAEATAAAEPSAAPSAAPSASASASKPKTPPAAAAAPTPEAAPKPTGRVIGGDL
jgi:tRNA A-37 threonylcarbamoyl transferase component Bud32